MGALLGIIVALIAMIAFGWLSSKTGRSRGKQSAKLLLGILAILGGVFLTLRGLGSIGVFLIPIGIGLLAPTLGISIPGYGQQRNPGSSSPSSQGGMTTQEARKVLGVSPDASRDDIQKAYKDMMKRVHPDAGGSDGLASQVQQARDILLGE